MFHTRGIRPRAEIVDQSLLALKRAMSAGVEEYCHVKVCNNYAILKQIGRLRHHQYIESQNKNYKTVVLEESCLIENCDFTSINLYTTISGVVSCAVRVGLLTDTSQPSAKWLLKTAPTIGIDPKIAVTCTRLVRDPNHSGRHAIDLMDFMRWNFVRVGYRYCVFQAAERLITFFRRMGCSETGIWSDDPAAGKLQILVLDTQMRQNRAEIIKQ
jgi:hypothetical protein